MLVIIGAPAVAGCCVDNFTTNQNLTADGALGCASVGEAAPFVRTTSLQITGSCSTSVTNPLLPPPVSVVDLAFQTSLTGDRWARVFLDVWLLEEGEEPAPDGVVRAVDTQHLGSELDLLPALFDPDDTTLHISPATLPSAGGAVVVRLRDKATAHTGELGRYEP